MVQLFFRLLAMLPAGARRKLVRSGMELIWNRYVEEHVHGREQIPDGPCLFICNHLSNADGYTLVRALRPKRVFFLAGVKLQGTLLTRVGAEAVETIPIRPNSADVEAFKRAVEMLKQGNSVLIFPEGTRSRNGELLPAKRGAALIARRAGVPVVPVALAGTEKFLPINDRDMGGEQPRHARIDVWIGKPFAVGDLAVAAAAGEDERQLLADAMMRRVAELLPQAYRGHYS
ncbi:MAG: 1-acyl-sn-glycerol-3-phosphate acyltransferase [Firmicutes bacterium]|nr:1-acyl-sn-glycerol-3-phosphate acyltransferase [Bacillota bacterium]